MTHAAVVPPHTIRYFKSGEDCADSLAGDLVLFSTSDIYAKIIKFGERLRLRDAKKIYARVNHAATALGDGTIVQMIGGGGTVTPLANYKHLSYAVIETPATAAQRGMAVAAAQWYVNVPYGFPSVASDSLYLLTGLPIALTVGQSVVCSAMATSTQRPLGLLPDKADIAMLPSDLARLYDVQLPT